MDNTTNTELIEKLYAGGGLCAEEYAQLIAAHTPQEAQLLYSYADALRDKYYGKDVYLRGLIEFSSYCKNDCIYCGLRRSNTKAQRYRLSQEDILECCRGGYELGYRTFVLQSGEDMHFTEDTFSSLDNIKAALSQSMDNEIVTIEFSSLDAQ